MEITVRQALEDASLKEQLAYEFYKKLLDVVKDLSAKEVLKELAQQELDHKNIIDKALEQGTLDALGLDASCNYKNLGIGVSSGLKPEVVTEGLNVQDVLLIAIKHEENSRLFYEEMVQRFKGTDAEAAFTKLAIEEACHRNEIQKMYDDIINLEN